MIEHTNKKKVRKDIHKFKKKSHTHTILQDRKIK